MTKQRPNPALLAVMKQVPALTDFGLGISWHHRRKSAEEQQAIFDRERADLMNTQSFEATCEWISQHLEKQKSLYRGNSSYGIKHIVEKQTGYITNGVFIAAMIALGYAWRPDGPNAFFNVTARSVNRAKEDAEQCRLKSISASIHKCGPGNNCKPVNFASYGAKVPSKG